MVELSIRIDTIYKLFVGDFSLNAVTVGIDDVTSPTRYDDGFEYYNDNSLSTDITTVFKV